MHDLAIAGAGPAGASAARAAALAGLSVLLLDKDVFPRHKPCGGALSVQGLDALGFPLPEGLAERDFHGGLLCIDGARNLAAPPARTGVLVQRRAFDALLVDKARQAGAEVREGEKVVAIEEDARGVTIRTEGRGPAGRRGGRGGASSLRASLLLVAEGAAGRLKLHVRPPDRPEDVNFCVCADVPCTDGVTQPDNPLLLHFGICDVTYGWVFPRRTDCSVGMSELGPHRRLAQAHFAELCRIHGIPLPKKVDGAKIPMGGAERPVFRGRVLLAGDAGGFADPLLGEGISHAVRTGQWAAEASRRALEAGDPLAAGPMHHALTRPLHQELRHALRLVRALERAPRRLFRAMLTHPPALCRYVDILSGRTTYADFTRFLKRRLPFYLLRSLWA